MNIGIIVHSQTDHTWSVAEKLQADLLAKGHQVAMERIRATDDQQPKSDLVSFSECPDPSPYEAVIFAAPVRAFSINPIIKAYLSRMPEQAGKQAACFVTMHLKKPWMGGNKATSTMSSLCSTKGMKVAGSAIVSWSSPQKDAQIDACVNKIASLF